MDGVFVFEKTFKDRVNDYEQVFFEKNLMIVPSRIRKEWSNYFDIVLEPSGWKALWKIPRERCNEFDISYPNVVLVYVLEIDYEELCAKVEILAVHGDIHLPDLVDAELMDLHPLVNQNSLISNISTTAEALEMFQYFYNNIWLPWDENDDAWTLNTIKMRLKLYFHVVEGKMRRPHVNYLRSLLKEGQQRRKTLTCSDQSIIPSLQEISAIEKRMIQLRNEFEPFINEEIREVLFMKREIEEETPMTILIFNTNTCEEHIEYITQCKNLIPSEEIPKTVTHLYDAFKVANKSTKILLGNGIHDLTNYSQGCEYVGTIIGAQDRLKTVISIASDSIALFEIAGEEMLLRNLKISVDLVTSAIIVRKGRMVLIDCVVESSQTLHTRQGIIVHPEGELIMKNCDLIGFNIGINCKEGSNIVLESCTITKCQKGMKISDRTNLEVSSTIIVDSTNCGIHLETETLASQFLCGEDFKSLLYKFPNFKIDSLKFENGIVQNDVRIVSKSRRIPFEDIVTPSHKFGEDLIDDSHSKSVFKKALKFGTDLKDEPMDADLGVEYLTK